MPALTSICNPLRTKKLQNLPILFLTGRDFNPSNFRTKLGLSVRSLAESRFRRTLLAPVLTNRTTLRTSRWRRLLLSAMDPDFQLEPLPYSGFGTVLLFFLVLGATLAQLYWVSILQNPKPYASARSRPVGANLGALVTSVRGHEGRRASLREVAYRRGRPASAWSVAGRLDKRSRRAPYARTESVSAVYSYLTSRQIDAQAPPGITRRLPNKQIREDTSSSGSGLKQSEISLHLQTNNRLAEISNHGFFFPVFS